MSQHRFRVFKKDLSDQDRYIDLDEQEAHHVFRVLRKQDGDRLEVLNGQGLKAQALVQGKRLLIENIQTYQAPSIRIHCLIGMLGMDKAKWICEKLSELGVSSVHWVKSDKSHVQLQDRHLQKMQKICIEAIKQSGNVFLPTMHRYKNINAALESVALSNSDAKILLDEDETCSNLGHCLKSFLETIEIVDSEVLSGSEKSSKAKHIVLAIGPEASWSGHEKTFLKQNHGYKAATLCEHILKVETACVVAVAQCQYLLSNSKKNKDNK